MSTTEKLVAITHYDLKFPWGFSTTDLAAAVHSINTVLLPRVTQVRPSTVMDVYVDCNNVVKLIELNPYGERGSTAPMLFHWKEDGDLLCGDGQASSKVIVRYSRGADWAFHTQIEI